jgi:glycosyltransferase involved in cell wall biosynthesis
VVFTGNLRYAPNADAALHLATQIFPLVHKAVPNAELLLVGRDPLPELREAAQRCEGITVTGFVDDVRPYLERAALFAAPLRFGAGIQNKVLEALAMELPVVASRVAAEGLHTVDGQRPPVEIASQPNDFVRAIVTLLARGAAPATEGRAYVERNFSWERSGDLVEQALAAAAGSRCIVSAALSAAPTSAF